MKSLTKLTKVKEVKLNPQQKLFTYYYTLNGPSLGNGYISYALAYDYKLPTTIEGKIDYTTSEYTVCQAASSRLLMTEKIKNEIERIMLDKLNNKTVDTRLSTILHYGKDADSINAIKIYNDLNNRIVKNLNLNVSARPFQAMSDEDLEKLANE